MADSTESSSHTPSYRGGPLCKARGGNAVFSSAAFPLTSWKNRRFRSLLRVTACLVIQAFLVFDVAWASGPNGLHTLRSQASQENRVASGLEEQLKPLVTANKSPGIQARHLKGPRAWLAIAMLMLGFSSQAMAQAPSMPAAPVSPLPVAQSVQQLQDTHQVAPSNLELINTLRGDGLTTFYFSWATHRPSGELADLQARYPDKKKVQVVYVQLVDGRVQPAWKVQSGAVEWGRMTFSTFWRVFPWGQGRSSYISRFPYALVVDKDGGVAVMDDSRGLVAYLNQRFQAEEQREAELRRIETERVQQEAQRKAEEGRRAEEARRKAQADVERLQKERKELTTQLQKLREEVEPLRKMVERLKELPKVLQQEIRKLEDQKRQADQAVKELEAKRSAVQAETERLQEEQARLAKEVGQAKVEAARAREEAARVASQQPPVGPVVETSEASSPWTWLGLGAGALLLAGGGAAAGYYIANKKKVGNREIEEKVPPPPTEPKRPADVAAPPGAALTPTSEIAEHQDQELARRVGEGVREKALELFEVVEGKKADPDLSPLPDPSAIFENEDLLTSQAFQPGSLFYNLPERKAAEDIFHWADGKARELTSQLGVPEDVADGLARKIISGAAALMQEKRAQELREKEEQERQEREKTQAVEAAREQREREEAQAIQETIRQRAYFKSLDRAHRGDPPNPDADWLEAEAEWRAKAMENIAEDLQATLSRSLQKLQEAASEKAIRDRAQEIYLDRLARGEPGDENSDWLQAESDLRAKALKNLGDGLQQLQEATPERLPDWATQVRDAVKYHLEHTVSDGAIRNRSQAIWIAKGSPPWQDEAGHKADWLRAEAELRAEAMKNLSSKLQIILGRTLGELQEVVPEEVVTQRAHAKYQARGGEPGYDRKDWFEVRAELTTETMESLASDLEKLKTATSEQPEGVQQQIEVVQAPSGQPQPSGWASSVINAVRQREEGAGQTGPRETYDWVVEEISKEKETHPAAVAALTDPNVLSAIESDNTDPEFFRKVYEEAVERHEVPPVEWAVVGYALGVASPQGSGIGIFRWMFDSVARVLRRFPEEDQSALLAEVDTLRSDARRMAKEAGINKPSLNHVLTDVVQEAATASDASQGLTALRTLLVKLIPKAREARLRRGTPDDSQSGYTSAQVHWDAIPFSTLLDQIIQLQQEGAKFDVEFVPERGHTEYYEDQFYPERSSSSFVIDNPQSLRLVVQQPPAAPPVLEPPKPPVLDHQFLKESGVLDALQNDRIGLHKLKEAAVWFDTSGIGLLPGYVTLSAFGQEVAIRAFEPGRRSELTPVRTILVRGEIAGDLHYEVIPRAEFDAMLGPDGFADWAVAVPTVPSVVQIEEVGPPFVGAVPEEAMVRLSREFPVQRLVEAANVYSSQGQAEIAEVADRRRRVEQLVEKVSEAGLSATQERFQKAVTSLTTQPDLLIGSDKEALMLWAIHRIAAELLGSDDPSKRLALFNEVVNASIPSEVEAAAAFALRLTRADEVQARAKVFGIQPAEVYPALQKAVWIATVTSEETIVRQLDGRNWLWRTSKVGERNLVLPRIQVVRDRLPMILERLDQAGEVAPISVYAMGGGIWSDKPNDLDLFVIVPGSRLYEIRTLLSAPGELPLHVRIVGLDTLAKAVAGQPVENRTNIRLEATVLYGSGILTAGTDLFAQSRPPEENLAPVAQHYRAAIQWLQTTPDVTEEQRLGKVERWIRELQAIEQGLAEHRERAQEAFVRQRVDELTQSITQLDEGLRRYFAPPGKVVDEQPAALIIPREALVEGVGVVSLRRLHETHGATVIAVAGNFTGEEKALLRRLDSRLRFIEGATVSDQASAARALEAARSSAWWTPDVPARVLVPTSDLNARPMELPGGRLLYYLAPDEAHLISLDILLQATHQDLFQPNFPVIQVILARIPIKAAGLKDRVYDFRERWALAAGA